MSCFLTSVCNKKEKLILFIFEIEKNENIKSMDEFFAAPLVSRGTGRDAVFM
jgi:hypothetical protein